MTLWQKLDRFPPVVIRLLARNPDGTAMTDREIAERGVRLSDVKGLSYLTDWDYVNTATARCFLGACNCDLEDPKVVRNLNRYLKRDPKFTHLRRSPRFGEFKEMLSLWVEHGTKTKAWPFYE